MRLEWDRPGRTSAARCFIAEPACRDGLRARASGEGVLRGKCYRLDAAATGERTVNSQSNESAAHDGTHSQTEREMVESRRQTEQRHARIVGRPANSADAPASSPNGNEDGTEAPQTSAPTDPAGQGICEPDEPTDDDRGWAPEQGAPAFGRLNSGQAPAQNELAEDDDIYHVPVEGDTAPPLVPDAPDEGDDYAPAGDAVAAPAPATIPAAIVPTFANFPTELTALPNWFMWRYVLKPGKEKPDKIPFQPNGDFAKTNDRSTWTTIDVCRAAYDRGGFDGTGFVFDGKVGDDGFCYAGVDFDRCIEDGELIEPARSRIARLQTYSEVSVSGTGVHCIARAKPGATIKHICAESGRSVEIYSKGRYFTFTGAPVGEGCGAIRAAGSEVDALVAEVRAEASAKTSPASSQRDGKLAELFVDPAMATQGPAAFFREMEIESLGEGIKDHWFDKLTPEQKDEAVHYILSVIAANTKLLELSENGGNNDDYYKLITALAVSGAPHAEEYFIEPASKVKNADSEEMLRAEFQRCKAAADGRITVGTLLHYAQQARADLSHWMNEVEAKPALPLPLPFINLSNWDNEPLPEREWAVPNRIPLRQVALFSGEGGAGKSYVTLHLCVAHALGRDWLHSRPTPGPSIFMDAEDDENELHIRLNSILRHYGITYADAVKGGLHLLSFVGRDAVLATVGRYNSKIEPTPLYGQLLQAAGDIKPKMIGIASAANIFAGNENDRSQVQQFASLLARIAQVASGSVQLISHPSLTGINSEFWPFRQHPMAQCRARAELP